jgi:gliding motility-associated-like protein
MNFSKIIVEISLLWFLMTAIHVSAQVDTISLTLSNLAEQKQVIGFEENKGQMADENNLPIPDVFFKVEVPGINIWVTTKGLTYQFFTIHREHLTLKNGEPKLNDEGIQERKKSLKWHRVDMILKGASILKENIITENNLTQGAISYYQGYCPSGIFNIQKYGKITIKEVYPGIDWVLYTSDSGGLKHDFIVHPESDPKKIQLIYEGSGDIKIHDDYLTFNNEFGEINEGKLICYQEGKNNSIEANYEFSKNNSLTYLGALSAQDKTLFTDENEHTFSYQLTINLGSYNRDKDLTIDPELVWGTMYGGNSIEGFMSMDTDPMGNVYVTGYTASSNFPLKNSGAFFQGTTGFSNSAIIIKFNSNGNRIWATYYGGGFFDVGNSIACDLLGNVYVTGKTSSINFPTQDAGTFIQPVYGGGGMNVFDAFILKFDNAGNREWATFFGGSGNDIGNSITNDTQGNVILTGSTASTNFPILNASQPSFAGGSGTDVFLAKFDDLGNQLWSTYMGGTKKDAGLAITTDSNNNIFLTGNARSTNFPLQNNNTYYQSAYGGGLNDLFISKIDALGNVLWSTYFGGSDNDSNPSIVVDNFDNVLLTGQTKSNDFPLLDAGSFFQATIPGPGHDIFILKFDNIGTLLSSTLYGGNRNDIHSTFDNIAVDNCNNVFVSFETKSTNILMANPGSCHYFDGTHAGAVSTSDNFIAQFDLNGDLVWSSYIGSFKNDVRSPIAIDNNNSLFMGGEFMLYNPGQGGSLPLQNPGGGAYFDGTPNGNDDSFILKFSQPIITSTMSQTNVTSCFPCDGSATVNLSCGLPPYSYLWSNGVQIVDTASATCTIGNLCSGNYSVIINSNCAQVDTLYFTITGSSTIDTTISASICQGDSIIIGGQYQFNAGVYYDTLYVVGGCDSVTITNLSINPSQNASFSYNGNTWCTLAGIQNPTINGLTGGVFGVQQAGISLDSMNGDINPANSISGVYNISYTTSGMCPGTSTVQITITPPPLAVFNYGVFCQNDPNPLPNFLNGGVNGLFSSTSNLSIDSLTGLINLNTSTPGQYTVNNAVTNLGCPTVSYSNQITINELPNAVISSSSIFCVEDTIPNIEINFTSGIGNWLINYNLNGVPTLDSTSSSPLIILGQLGTYNSFSIIDGNGCINNIVGQTILDTFPTSSVQANPDYTFCESDLSFIQAFTTNATGSSISWSNISGQDLGFGLSGLGDIDNFISLNGTSSSESAIIIVESLTINGCIGIPDTFLITINPTPLVSFTGNPLSGCEPLEIEFTNTSLTQSQTCEWNFGDGNFSYGCGVVNNTYLTGNFDVSLTITSIEGCQGTITYPQYVTVTSPPTASFSFSPNTISTENPTVQFMNNSTNADNYLWEFQNGNIISTEENPLYEFPDLAGDYYTTLWAFSANGLCKDSIQQLITIHEKPLFYIPNVFTPDGNSFNEIFQPIFTSGFDPYDFHLTIFNRWGEVVFESYNASLGWNGLYGDRLVEDGVYIWSINFKESMSDRHHQIKGHVSVLK